MDIIKILFTTPAGWIIIAVTVLSILMSFALRWWIKQQIKKSAEKDQ